VNSIFQQELTEGTEWKSITLLSLLPPVQFFLLLILGVFLFAPVGRAHEARPAYLEIKETAPGKFSVLWRTPVLAGMRLPLVLKIPDDVKNLQAPVVQELADSLVERRWIDAGPNGLSGKRIEFVGLQLTITDVLVRLEMLDGRKSTTIARPSQPWVEVAASQSWWEVMGTYIVEGIRHILFGADHMLFVLGLLLIVKNRWMLLKTVTAFTVAHSITLAIATLGYAEAPVLPLNAAIALSILFLGPEIVRQNDARGGIRDAGCGIGEQESRISNLVSRTSHHLSRIL
jgi:HupE / UreJ protein